jgi:hypothetical protein
MTIGNLETGDVLSAQFNPDEVKETIGANFAELDILGMSHKPQQYKNTDNLEVVFEMAFDGVSLRGIPGTEEGSSTANIAAARRFLHHLFYSRKTSQDVTGGGPPRVFLFWPELYSMTCRIQKLVIVHKRFAKSSASTLFTASITVREALDVRVYSEDVLERGPGQKASG